MGPRVDMRRDQGGLCAVGRWFLPRPAVEREYHNIVELESRTGPGRNARRVVVRRGPWTGSQGRETGRCFKFNLYGWARKQLSRY